MAGVPNELAVLKERTGAVQAERDHYKQLGKRAANAFEDHRRDLTQLAQKERAIRARREDELRVELQDALKANRDLMARVVEQRRQQDAAWRAELQGHRADSAQRHAELDALLAQLHTERAELQRSVVSAERTRDVYRHEIEDCLEEQEQLQGRVRLLRDGLTYAGVREGELGDGDAGASGGGGGVARHQWPNQCSQRARQLCCECCDAPSRVWRGASPTRRVPRRRFVPSGPLDVCSPSRATSPTSHHVDALLSSIERGNYLRPRLYYQRCGRAESQMSHAAAFIEARDGEASHPERSRSLRTASAASHLTRLHDHRARSQGLSSTTTSLTSSASRPPTADACSFSSTTSPSSEASVSCSKQTEKNGACGVKSRERTGSPPRGGGRTASLRRREDDDAGMDTRPYRSMQRRQHQSAQRSSSPARHSTYHGAALNSVCHSLISDLADVRAEYQRYQQQLRDPHGDSVEASREMRRLMRQMDDKISQIRSLRKEQEKHRDSLRLHDVLQQVMLENQYCEAVYKDLMELIRA